MNYVDDNRMLTLENSSTDELNPQMVWANPIDSKPKHEAEENTILSPLSRFLKNVYIER